MQKVKVSAHLIWIWILSRWKSSVEEADWRPNRISHRSEGFLGFQYHANNKMNTMICEVKCQIWRSMELWEKNQCLSYLTNRLDQIRLLREKLTRRTFLTRPLASLSSLHRRVSTVNSRSSATILPAWYKGMMGMRDMKDMRDRGYDSNICSMVGMMVWYVAW